MGNNWRFMSRVVIHQASAPASRLKNRVPASMRRCMA
jgi:hypothetical protein